MHSYNIRRAALVLNEIKLYYEELRDVNARTQYMSRAIVLIALAQATYILFGLKQAISIDFWRTFIAQPDAVRGSAKVYALLGGGMTLMLYGIVCFAIPQFGHSRRHKCRYWRSISLLREQLHNDLELIPKGRSRFTLMQTGLEPTEASWCQGQVPRPLIKKAEFAAGYCIAVLNGLLFIISATVFGGIWQFAALRFDGSFVEPVKRAFIELSPVLAILIIIDIKAATEYCRQLKIAQVITPSTPYCSLGDPSPSKRAARILLMGVIILVALGIAIPAITFWGPELPHSIGLPLALILVAGVTVHRLVAWGLSHHTAGAICYKTIKAIVRLGGRGDYERRATTTLAVLCLSRKRAEQWAQEAKDGRKRPKVQESHQGDERVSISE